MAKTGRKRGNPNLTAQKVEKKASAIVSEMKEQPKKDFFFIEDRDPRFRYRWAEKDERRVQELKRHGYEVDPSVSCEEAKKKKESQRQYLLDQLNDPNITKENAEVAKGLLEITEKSQLDTTVNIPECIRMRIPEEKYQERVAAKRQISERMGEKIQRDIAALNTAIKKSGLGGIEAFKGLFQDALKDKMQRR